MLVYESWFGIVNRKGELLAVEESEDIARSAAFSLEIDISHPTNRLMPVTIIVGMKLEDYVLGALEAGKSIKHKREQQAAHEKALKAAEADERNKIL